MTAEILASCGRVGAALGQPVRYLSVLEGGYDIPAICRSAVCHVRALLEGIPQGQGKQAGRRGDQDGGAEGDVDFKAQCGAVVAPVGAPIQSSGAAKAEDGELAAMMEYLAECGITGDEAAERAPNGSADDGERVVER